MIPRISLALVLMTAVVLLSGLQAAALSPAEARDEMASTVQTLIDLDQTAAEEYFHTGDWDKAVAALDRITVLRPLGTEPYSTAAWLLWSQNRNEEAMEHYQRMLAANPGDPMGYFDIGMYFYKRMQNVPEAAQWFGKAVDLGLPSPYRHQYGHVLAELGRTGDALAFWQRVLAEEPENPVARREADRLTGKAPPAPETKAE